MRLKKIVSGILACAMVVTSVLTGDVATVKAEVQMPDPIANYDFNGTLSEDVELFEAGLTDYSGVIADSDYVEGRSAVEGDKALKLGNFGLRLPEKNIGKTYTVSMWVNRTGNLTNFMPILFLGRGADGQWIGIAGAWGNADGAILWGGNNADSILSADEASFALEKEQWVMLTITQENNNISIYKNGTLVKNITTKLNTLDGENQGIHLGVNPYSADGIFPGLVDDVNVYNQALTAKQVLQLYYGKTEREMFEEEGIATPANHAMYVNDTWKIPVTLPPLVDSEDVTISFNITNQTPESSGNDVLTLAADGTITAEAAGTASITTSAVFGEGENVITKDQVTSIEVKEEGQKDTTVIVDYDLSCINNGKIKDVSGNNNDAVVEGASGISFVVENREAAIKLASDDSYLKLPSSIMDSLTNKEEFTIETTFAKSASCGNNAWLFCLGSKIKSTGTNYMFLSPNFESKTLRAGIKDNSTEKLFGTAIAPIVDNWYTVDMVFDHGMVKLYWNGVLIRGDTGDDKLESGYSIMDDIVTPGTENNILGYIGKSCFSNDKNYQGKISSFKIYNKALTDAEVQESKPEYLEALRKKLDDELDIEDILSSNTSSSEIIYSLNLPSELEEIPLTWSCDPEGVISESGAVKNGTADQSVTLTATLKSGALVATKDFKLTVKALNAAALQARIAEAEKTLSEINESIKDILNIDDLESAIAKAKAAITASYQSGVDSADIVLKRAIDNLYPAEFIDPFTAIDDSNAGETVTMAPGAEENLIVIPERIKAMVDVTYTSSDSDIADVNSETGVVTAKKAGYSKITTTVTAKYDDFEMDYQTLVKVDFDMSKVTVELEYDEIAVHGTTKINVTLPEGVSVTPTITCQADDDGVIVTEDEDGDVIVKGAVEGDSSVTVTVRAGGKIKAFPNIPIKVEALDPEHMVTVVSEKDTVKQGESAKVSIEYHEALLSIEPDISCTVSEKLTRDDAADVEDEEGYLTGLTVRGYETGTGKITIAVVSESEGITVTKEASIKVTELDMSAINAAAEKSTLKVGDSTGINITGADGDAYQDVALEYAYTAGGAVSVAVDPETQKATATAESMGQGTVTVTITAGAKSETRTVHINVGEQGEGGLSGIAAAAEDESIEVGSTTKIIITYPDDVAAANPIATYEASGAVSVDTEGNVTGESVGSGTVTVTVTVGDDSVELAPIEITVTEKTSGGPNTNPGGSSNTNPGGGANTNQGGGANTNQGGGANTNPGGGSSTNQSGGSNTSNTTVDLSKATVKAKATKIAKGKTTTISISYPNAATKAAASVTYKASGAVSVSKAGKVTGKKAGKGTVTVTIKASGQSAITKKITINVGAINGKSTVKVKKSITLKVKGISGKVKWSVNKKKLASISSKGKLKAKKAGKVKVTAKVGSVKMTKTITIKK